MDALHNAYVDLFGGEKIGLLDTSQETLYIAAIAIAFNPIAWNLVAQHEHRTRFLTKFFKSPYTGCYFLAAAIFTLGLFRDSLFSKALTHQPLYPPIHLPALGVILFIVGNTLVLSSYYRLGITGTFLGDYFGILMDEKVEGFPFSVTASPMYIGSTLNFLAASLYFGKVAGLVLTAEVFVMYAIALQFEE